MALDDSFRTVSFLRSGAEPPNWNQLIADCSTARPSSDLDLCLDLFSDEEVPLILADLAGFGVPKSVSSLPGEILPDMLVNN